MADDKKAVARGLRRRDPELLDRLIEQHQYRLFRYLLYITGSQERAEDFLQETWIRVLERGHQYDGKYKFEAWLFAIARNRVIDWQRQKGSTRWSEAFLFCPPLWCFVNARRAIARFPVWRS